MISREGKIVKSFGEFLQSEDWKKEKHVPVIECAESVKEGEILEIRVTVGKEIAHPNTTEHHIRWIQIFFKPDDDKFAYQLADCRFTAHGECVEGPNKGPAYTNPVASAAAVIKKSGTILALGFCNIHGVWENSKKINVA